MGFKKEDVLKVLKRIVGRDDWEDMRPAPAKETPHIEAEPIWLSIARKEIGVKEYKVGENPRIIEYHQATSLKATTDETPWCSALVNFCLKQAGVTGTNSARARSFLAWGETLHAAQTGCIVILKRGKNPQSGHVGFAVGLIEDHVLLLSGNVGDKVCIAPFLLTDVLGYRFPKGDKWKNS